MRGVALAVVVLAAGGSPAPGGGGLIVVASDRAPDLGRAMFTALTAHGPVRRNVLGFAPQGSTLAPDGRRYAAVSFTRGEGGRLLVGTLGGAARTVATSPYEITEPVWSPGGRRIAYDVVNPTSCGPADHACATYELWLVPATGGAARRVASAARLPVWSPDGRLIAFVGKFQTYDETGVPAVASTAGGAERRLVRKYVQGGLAWSPNGRRLAFPTVGGSIVVVAPAGGSARAVTAGRAVAWVSSSTLAVARRRTGLALVRTGGSVLRAFATPGGQIDALAASPGGGQLAYLERNGAKQPPSRIVAAVDLRTGRTRQLLRADQYAVVSPPAWSRDGSRVVVTTTRDDNDSDLFTMRPDGSQVRQVTNDAVFELDPALSPDGRTIVFTSPTASAIPQSGVFALRLKDRSRRTLTTPPLGTEDLYPAWSRDGSRIAFVRTAEPAGFPAAELWTTRADGTDARRLFTAERGLLSPTWSPDGSQIAFGRSDLQRPALWVVGADGSDPHELTAAGGLAAPAWSPDGARLAFVAAGTAKLLVFDPASGATTVAAEDGEWGTKPAWSPDGSRIAYLGTDHDVHSVLAWGGGEADLTPGPGREWGLDWSRASASRG
jgi:Tol biopolymer transport system component